MLTLYYRAGTMSRASVLSFGVASFTTSPRNAQLSQLDLVMRNVFGSRDTHLIILIICFGVEGVELIILICCGGTATGPPGKILSVSR